MKVGFRNKMPLKVRAGTAGMNVGAGLIVSVLYGTAGIIILLVGIILGIVFTAVREQYTEDV